MKNFGTLIFILLISVSSYAQTGQQKISIAIMDFQNTSDNGKLDYLQKAIPEALTTRLAESGNLNIVERSRLDDAIKEMKLGMVGLVDQNEAAEIGKAVGANAIMVGSFLEISNVIRLNARLIEVQTSKVLIAKTVQGRVGSEIFNLMDGLAKSIEEQLSGKKDEKKTEPPPPPTPRPEPQPQSTRRSYIPPPPKKTSYIGLRFVGDVSYISHKQFNDFVNYVNENEIDYDDPELPNLNLGIGGEVEGILSFGTISFGLGIGFLSGKMTYENSESNAYEISDFTYTHSISAIPIVGMGYLNFPLTPSIQPYLGGGIALYIAQAKFEVIEDYTEYDSYGYIDYSGNYEEKNELSATGLGFHGVFGLGVNISDNLALDLRMTLRYASIKGFEGESNYVDDFTGGYESGTEDVWLVYGEDSYGEIWYGPTTSSPDELDVDEEEGKIDFSGVGFVIGLKIMLPF